MSNLSAITDFPCSENLKEKTGIVLLQIYFSARCNREKYCATNTRRWKRDLRHEVSTEVQTNAKKKPGRINQLKVNRS